MYKKYHACGACATFGRQFFNLHTVVDLVLLKKRRRLQFSHPAKCISKPPPLTHLLWPPAIIEAGREGGFDLAAPGPPPFSAAFLSTRPSIGRPSRFLRAMSSFLHAQGKGTKPNYRHGGGEGVVINIVHASAVRPVTTESPRERERSMDGGCMCRTRGGGGGDDKIIKENKGNISR